MPACAVVCVWLADLRDRVLSRWSLVMAVLVIEALAGRGGAGGGYLVLFVAVDGRMTIALSPAPQSAFFSFCTGD